MSKLNIDLMMLCGVTFILALLSTVLFFAHIEQPFTNTQKEAIQENNNDTAYNESN